MVSGVDYYDYTNIDDENTANEGRRVLDEAETSADILIDDQNV